MRRQHVVIGGDDADIDGRVAGQRRLVFMAAGRETVGQISTGKRIAMWPLGGLRLDALQIVLPRRLAAIDNAFRHFGDCLLHVHQIFPFRHQSGLEKNTRS